MPLELEEALRALRRNVWFSALMVMTLAVGVAVFATARTSRVVQETHVGDIAPGVYHVELSDFAGACDRGLDSVERLIRCYPDLLLAWEEAVHLARLGAAREGGGITFLAETLVRAPSTSGDRPSHYRNLRARFSSSAIFDFFRYEFVAGRAFTEAEEQTGAPVAVIDDALAAEWFPGESALGKKVVVRGQSFEIVGVARYDATVMRPQDLGWYTEPNLHLPASSYLTLRPTPVNRWSDTSRRVEPTDERIPGERWVEVWVRLESAASVAGFLADARAFRNREVEEGRLDPEATIRLRSPESWTALLTFIFPAYRVFELIGVISLLAAAFGLMRLIMARQYIRMNDLAIRRAFGAPDRCLVIQQLIAGALIGVVGGGLGLALASVGLELMTRAIVTTHVRLALDLEAALVALFWAVAAALFAASYPAWRFGRLSPAEALRRR